VKYFQFLICTEAKECAVDDECSTPLWYRISEISNMLKQEQFDEEAVIAELAKSSAAQWWEHSAADPTNLYAYGENGIREQAPNTPSGAVHAVCTCLYAFCCC
jgi:hypothetical protein